MVLVTDRMEATLRWAGNSMTTNGVAVSRNTTVISVVRQGESAFIGTVVSAEVDQSLIPGLVAASQQAARSAPEAGDAAPLLADTAEPAHWDAPVSVRSRGLARIAGPLSRGFRGKDRLYGYAHHSVSTTFLASSTGLRRRYTQPEGAVEINGKRGDASAWAGVGTPDFTNVPIDSLLEELSLKLGWAERTVELPAGRYEYDHAAVDGGRHDDLHAWSMVGRGAQEGQPLLGARRRHPVGGAAHRVAADVVLRSDGSGPAQYAVRRGEQLDGDAVGVRQRNGDRAGRLDPQRGDQRAGLSAGYRRQVRRPCPVAADNLVMTGGSNDLADMIAGTEHGLLLTTLWYIREVDPTTLLLTGLTRDGVYLIEGGESPGRSTTSGSTKARWTCCDGHRGRRQREDPAARVGDWATRAAMPSLRIPDFHMSSVSQAQ